MGSNRLTLVLEFNKSNPEEVEMYNLIRAFSSPQGILKDILKGKLPVSLVQTKSKE